MLAHGDGIAHVLRAGEWLEDIARGTLQIHTVGVLVLEYTQLLEELLQHLGDGGRRVHHDGAHAVVEQVHLEEQGFATLQALALPDGGRQLALALLQGAADAIPGAVGQLAHGGHGAGELTVLLDVADQELGEELRGKEAAQEEVEEQPAAAQTLRVRVVGGLLDQLTEQLILERALSQHRAHHHLHQTCAALVLARRVVAHVAHHHLEEVGTLTTVLGTLELRERLADRMLAEGEPLLQVELHLLAGAEERSRAQRAHGAEAPRRERAHGELAGVDA
mmetsp:Transcript_12388/g.37502  ORF Transcript_12388/g.37502 Transcript_12388/m.37502 type:complete len:278 (+) Transcript_12388:1173-2006(+)